MKSSIRLGAFLLLVAGCDGAIDDRAAIDVGGDPSAEQARRHNRFAGGSTGGSAGTANLGGSTGAGGLTGAGGATTPSGTGGAAVASTTGTIVPLYTYPTDASWTAIATAKRAHPSVPVIAVVNPDSGPSTARDASYASGITNLESAGIKVIGYVATGYTSRGIAAVETDIDRWKSFYPNIQGIFFDEQSNVTGQESFYRTVSQYAKAQGMTFTVGNPGTDTGPSYVGAVDVGLIYESFGLPGTSALTGWHASFPKSNFGIIPYGAALDHAYVKAAKALVGYIYITNDDLPNPWDSLPANFSDLLADLE